MSLDEAIQEVVRRELRPVVERLDRVVERLERSGAAGDEGYMTVAEAAAYVRVHPATIRDWLKDGTLPRHHAGRELRVRKDELRRAMASPGEAPRATLDELAEKVLRRRK